MIPIPNEMIEAFAREVLRLRSEYEFGTFWLGTRVAGPVTQEGALAIKAEVNRRVGQRVEQMAPGLVASLERAVMRIELNYPDGGARVERLQPLLIYGRYRKLSREIPQSKWPCRRCHGAGVLALGPQPKVCDACGGTGKRFLRSVEELIAAPVLAICRPFDAAFRQAEGHEQGRMAQGGTKMHSVGREDVDARMLGRGRPFVLELAMPRVRTFELAPIQEALNRTLTGEVELEQLQFADRDLLERMVRMSPDKSYRAAVECLAPVPREAVERLGSLRDLTLRQETPRRVLHRRPNLVRRRTVRTCSAQISEPGPMIRRFELTARVESGTYIKELISGDEGRTHPSVSALLRVPCDCAELDVLEVHCDPVAEPWPADV
jgi:tRNA pseudouridine synthase 10